MENNVVKAYMLSTEELSPNVLEDIKNYKTFGCRAVVDDYNAVLGDTPISVRYIKAKVKYTYIVEQATSVTIKQKPKTIVSTTTSSTTTMKIAETKIAGFNAALQGDFDGFKANGFIDINALGKQINQEEYAYESDDTKKALFTYYDFDNDGKFDIAAISERNELNQYQIRYILIQKESKSYNAIIDKFNSVLTKQDVIEMQGSLKVVKN
jgi:hypothetical protein